MSFFGNKPKVELHETDWSRSLKELSFYKLGHLRSFGTIGEIVCIAVDPIASLIAIGTSTGLIHIIGSPAFQCTLFLSTSQQGPSTGVKFLTFHPGASRLICIDVKDTLHSWYLGPGCMDDHKNLPTKEITVSLYGNVTCIDVPSPSHSHLFFTLKDGNTLAFDLARRNLSPYKIPNIWAMHEERLRRSGVPGRGKTLQTPMATCLAMHPRDLNVMLVGFDGGVIAWDMNERAAAKTFELILPPGAPGGSSYTDPLIWTERRPSVTCLAWRPDGLAFAVGHEDGCISIWAFDDPDRPLMVRTITQEDVNMTDAVSLYDSGALSQSRQAAADAQAGGREPIFKLTWVSFPDGPSIRAMMASQVPGERPSAATIEYAERGETLLMVLGGTPVNQTPAINILQFPPYSAPAAPLAKTISTMAGSEGLTRAERVAYRDSLDATGISSYTTPTPAEDFVLMPRSSPYFGLAHDPIAIIIVLTPDPNLPEIPGPKAGRSVQMYTFPPPRSHEPPPEPGRKDHLTPPLVVQDHSAYPMSQAPPSPGMLSPRIGPASPSGGYSSWRKWSSAPASPSPVSFADLPRLTTKAKPVRPLRLPAILWTGERSVTICDVHPLDLGNFKRLIRWSIEEAGREEKPKLPLHGGTAIADIASHGAPDPKAIKFEAYRIMTTVSLDLAVRFWDISPHILVLPSPLKFEYPSPLPHLTISIANVLKHPTLAHTPIARLYKEKPSAIKIASVTLSTGSLECMIAMSTGEVFLYKFAEASLSSKEPEDYFMESQESEAGQATVDEITNLSHLANPTADGFKPVMLFIAGRGPVVAAAVSDTGFMAVAFAQKSFAVIDMRGPDVILREGYSEDGRKVKKRKGSQNLPGESQAVAKIQWTICRVGVDPAPGLRLVVSYAKGLTKILTLGQILGEWVVEPKAVTFSHDSLAIPLRSFVIDYNTGEDLIASPDRLVTVLRTSLEARSKGSPIDKTASDMNHCVWIACAAKAVRAQYDFSGDRIGKLEMPLEDELKDVHIVTKNGNRVLVGITALGSAVIYSIPGLNLITRLDLFFGSPQKPIGRISIDTRSGDYIEHISSLEIHLRTIFNHRKPLLPRLDPSSHKAAVLPQPIPVNATSGLSSWIWGGAPMTGAQLDHLVAGPNRPGLPKPPAKPMAPLITWGTPPEEPIKVQRPVVRPAVKKNVAQKQYGERVDPYEEMTAAARERGLTLDNLNERMNDMSIAASDMVKSAKTLAAKETAKATARSWFGI